MKPEWITAIVAGVLAAAELVNVLLSLKMNNRLMTMERRILDRVAREYKRQDVCTAEMTPLREACGR